MANTMTLPQLIHRVTDLANAKTGVPKDRIEALILHNKIKLYGHLPTDVRRACTYLKKY